MNLEVAELFWRDWILLVHQVHSVPANLVRHLDVGARVVDEIAVSRIRHARLAHGLFERSAIGLAHKPGFEVVAVGSALKQTFQAQDADHSLCVLARKAKLMRSVRREGEG